MKIKLPKTLAEPLTIPWVVKSSVNGASEIDISEALHRLMDNYVRRGTMPGKSDSPKEVHNLLRLTAMTAGADNAMATSYPMIECKTHVGDDYVVLFSLPNSKSIYNWSRKSWYGSSSVMYPP